MPRTKRGSRGQKKPSLSDLSRQLPSEAEWEVFYNEILAQTDRGAVLIMGSLVDATLRLALECTMVAMDPAQAAKVFEGSDAPLGGFYARIRTGKALGIYGERLEKNLGVIRVVRNQFAHALIPLTLEHPLVTKECALFPLAMLTKWPLPNEWSDTRIRFVSACFEAADFLVGWSINHGGREIEVEDIGPASLPQLLHRASPGKSSQEQRRDAQTKD